MDRVVVAQRDFSAGQIDETSLRREDTDIQRAGLRTARNVRLLNSGAMERRPGRRQLFQIDGITERIRPAVGQYWYMTFDGGRVTFRSAAGGSPVVFDGMPWSSGILTELRYDVSGGNVIVVHQSHRPQVFSYNAVAQTWSAAAFAFEGQNLATRQPFHQFSAGSGITLRPDNRAGDIQIYFSAPYLVPEHVGVFFRWNQRQIQVKSVDSSMHGVAGVAETLPPTFTVSVDNVAGLAVGDIIEGVNSGCKGQVTSVDPVNKAFLVVVSANWNGFDMTGGVGGGGEKIAGPRSSMKVQAFSEVQPSESIDWEEALMSDYRGWPGHVASDQQRLCFSNFKQYGAGIVWSAIGTLNDFLVGADAEDAIFEYIPENCQVLSMAGYSGDEFVLTDTGVFYIPISSTSPLKPGSVSFRKISSDGSSTIRAQSTTDGLAFVNSGRTRVLAVQPTGQQAAPYLVQDMTELHSALIKSPVALAITPSDVIAPERYLYAVNADGTMAVARYDRSRKWVGWVPWDGVGAVRWVSASGPEVTVDVEYDTLPVGLRQTEAFDDSMEVDGVRPLSGGNPYSLPWASGLTIAVLNGSWYRGSYDVATGGVPTDDILTPPSGSLMAGFAFVVEAEPFVPQTQEGASRKQRLRRRRLSQVACVVQRSQAIEVAGRLVPFWLAGENQEIAPPLRDEVYRSRVMGRDFDPRWSVKQTLPGALTILELTTEVTV